MENSTPRPRETNLVLQLMKASPIKNKTEMTRGPRKKKEGILYRLFCSNDFVNICVLSQCIMY